MKNKEANEIMAEDWFDEDAEEFRDEPDMSVLLEFFRMKSQVALELTKLVLEHCKMEKVTQKDIYRIFNDSIKMSEKLDVEHATKS